MIETFDPVDEPREDDGHVPGPSLPVLPVAALLDDLRVERTRREVERRHGDRQDDVAVPLTRRLAHDTPDGLHDLDRAVARVHEQHRVERRDVDALRQAARVREDTAGSLRGTFQPLDPGLAVERVMLAVDMARLAAERFFPFRLR